MNVFVCKFFGMDISRKLIYVLNPLKGAFAAKGDEICSGGMVVPARISGR
jgi:hypothetical protein